MTWLAEYGWWLQRNGKELTDSIQIEKKQTITHDFKEHTINYGGKIGSKDESYQGGWSLQKSAARNASSKPGNETRMHHLLHK